MTARFHSLHAAQWLLRGIVGLPLFLGLTWAAMALWFDSTRNRWLAGLLVLLFLSGCVALLIKIRPWRKAAAFLAALVLLVILWWNLIPPRNDRNWRPEVSQLTKVNIDGNQLTIENLRNFDYRSPTDFTPRWETRSFNLEDLRGVDMLLSSWGSDAIAHTITSWDFGGGQHLSVSIETRKEEGESYSAIRGFFRQFEVYYVVADERDLVRLRTNYRGETVYLYRLQVPPEVARALLLDFIAEINRLNERPQWYNALTYNCTTAIRHHARRIHHANPWNWRILLNGHLEDLAYERGMIDTSLSLPELVQASNIVLKAKAADADADFSQRIREGLPGFIAPTTSPTRM